jgi:hypothetical protein
VSERYRKWWCIISSPVLCFSVELHSSSATCSKMIALSGPLVLLGICFAVLFWLIQVCISTFAKRYKRISADNSLIDCVPFTHLTTKERTRPVDQSLHQSTAEIRGHWRSPNLLHRRPTQEVWPNRAHLTNRSRCRRPRRFQADPRRLVEVRQGHMV